MKYIPLDCPLCTFMLRDEDDGERYLKSGCCVDCWVSFLGPIRALEKDATYLPSEIDLSIWKEKVKKQNNLIKQG